MIRGEALYGRKPCDLKRCGVKNAELSWHNDCQMSAATRVHSFQSDAVERVCLHGGTSHDKHLKPFTLRQERDSALADFLHRQFSSENTPFICPACFNEVPASRGEGDDPHAQVFGALDPFATRRSTAMLIEPGVRSTIGPIALTGKGPLWSSTSNTRKSESPSPVPSIPAARSASTRASPST